jgi:hypothetical protein
MATRIRRVPGIEVPREQRAEWMGHVDQADRTTEAWYERLDEDHLVEAARATDAVVDRLSALMRSWRLTAPTSIEGRGKLLVVDSDKISMRQA